MTKQIPEQAYLMKKVEEKFGRNVKTSNDFDLLSIVIERDTGDFVSSSTLKRIWGYVSLQPVPRVATLDVLCRFLGYPSFGAWREAQIHSPEFESDFFTTKYILSEELPVGSRLIIGWQPNRLVTLEYLGENRFRVLESANSKLREGDEFVVSQFLLGYPLFIDHIDRADGPTPSFVAGKVSGLNRLEKL